MEKLSKRVIKSLYMLDERLIRKESSGRVNVIKKWSWNVVMVLRK